MTVFIIFPHHLFENIEPLKLADTIYIIEEDLFFNQYAFHKQKILLHHASMQYYKDYLTSNQLNVNYISAQDTNAKIELLINTLAKQGINKIICYNVIDNWLGKQIRKAVNNNQIELEILESPLFINTHNTTQAYFGNNKKFLHNDFYIQQRKQHNILLKDEGKPEGDKWSFDAENRLKYPKDKSAPKVINLKSNKYIAAAKIYVEKYYNNNYGDLNSNIIYPTTHETAQLC